MSEFESTLRARREAVAGKQQRKRGSAGCRWLRAASKVAAVLGAGWLLVGLTACAATPRGQTKENLMEYLRIARALEAEGAPLAPGSDDEKQALERFQDLLSDFTAPDFAPRIREVYAEDAWLNDTLKTLSGVDEIESYLAATAKQVDEGTVEFLDVLADNGNYYLRWRMRLRFKRLARGEVTESIGMTHVRFDADGKVLLHQDFWDSTGGLFEHVPGLGWMLRRAKARL